jgi:hypothetical protein
MQSQSAASNATPTTANQNTATAYQSSETASTYQLTPEDNSPQYVIPSSSEQVGNFPNSGR